MKLSSKTLSILKNFSTINSGIFFKKGNVLTTVSPQMNIFSEAVIEETIPQDFGIYSLTNFLSVVSLFEEGMELEFDAKNVIIKSSSGQSKIIYRCVNPLMIVVPPDKHPNVPSIDVSFSLSEQKFDWITKTAKVLTSPNIAVVSDGTQVNLVAFDIEDDSAHSNYTVLPEVDPQGNTFRLVFKTENLKMLPANYFVGISSEGLAKFVSDNKLYTYYVTLETSSTYN